MAKKAAKKHVHIAPQFISWRHVHKDLGGEGRVCLYDTKMGVPDLLPAPPDGTFESTRWLLVHFPSRRWAAVKAKAKALRILDEIHKGQKDELSILPPKAEKPQVRAGARAITKPVPDATAPKEDPPPQAEGAESKKDETPEFVATDVPDGLSFDKAFQYVFPVQRLTANLERLLVASNPVYDKEGNYCGQVPNYMAQIQAQKMAMEYHQGRPDVKEKAKEEKPPLTLQEIRAKMVLSDEYRAGFLEMVEDCAREAAARKIREAEERKAQKKP